VPRREGNKESERERTKRERENKERERESKGDRSIFIFPGHTSTHLGCLARPRGGARRKGGGGDDEGENVLLDAGVPDHGLVPQVARERGVGDGTERGVGLKSVGHNIGLQAPRTNQRAMSADTNETRPSRGA